MNIFDEDDDDDDAFWSRKLKDSLVKMTTSNAKVIRPVVIQNNTIATSPTPNQPVIVNSINMSIEKNSIDIDSAKTFGSQSMSRA
jgi:hypothetical protein